MSKIVPEVVAAVTRVIAEVDPDKLNDREVIAYLAGISETASGMLKLKPDLKAHADLVMDLANRVFHANSAAEQRGYDRAIAKLRTGAVHERDENTSTALWAVYLAGADYLEAVKDQP